MTASPTPVLRALLVAALLSAAGCAKDDAPTSPGTPAPALYGSGDVSFDAAGAGGTYHASGAYIPSTEFADDTASAGAGGMLHDSVAAGRPYQARLNTFTHALRAGLMSERVLVVTLDAGGPLGTGDYAIVPDGAPTGGRTARVTYLYFSDSLAEYAAFEGSAGVLSVTELDTTAGTAAGSFSGTLRSVPPDTTRHTTITGGTFHLTLVRRYYDY